MNEMPEWYLRWVKKHARAFALSAEASNTVLAWGHVFIKLFTPAELDEATDELIGSAAGLKWVTDHRPAIVDAVTSIRNKKRDAKRTESYSVCLFCHSTGWVSVPHPGMVPGTGRLFGYLRTPRDDPKGLNRELAVHCDCEIGKRSHAGEQERKREGLTLTAYEQKYPNFREIQREREAIQRAAMEMPSQRDYANLARLLAKTTELPRTG